MLLYLNMVMLHLPCGVVGRPRRFHARTGFCPSHGQTITKKARDSERELTSLIAVTVCKTKKKCKNWSRHPHLAALSQAPSDRHPARHPTVEMSLHGETRLKCHLHCLGPRAAIAGFPCEWVATAGFALGAAGRFLWGWDRDGENIERLLSQTDHYSRKSGCGN